MKAIFEILIFENTFKSCIFANTIQYLKISSPWLSDVDAVDQKCPIKKVFWKISHKNSHENTCVGVSFLTKLQAWGLLRNTFFTEHLPATASFYNQNNNTKHSDFAKYLFSKLLPTTRKFTKRTPPRVLSQICFDPF